MTRFKGFKLLSAVKKYWTALKRAAMAFIDDRAMKMSASLSYYTVFSLAPMLVIIITIVGWIYGRDAIEGRIFYQIEDLVGASAALQIQTMIQNVTMADDSTWATALGVATLLIGATTMFGEIQDSINTIWGIKPKPKRGWLRMLINRLLSFSMVVTIGFLMLVSLVINALMDIFIAKLKVLLQDFTAYLVYGINFFVLWGVTTLLFAIVFKVLPDGKVTWRDALRGAGFTAVLFMLGKFAIGLYLGNSDIASAYGAAGSIILILLWVYYSSVILFFGAEFTKEYAFLYGTRIEPNSYAVHVEHKEVERETYKRTDLATDQP
ncbi:MAG TPA: YihY/virulence factor BrkB family protein [Chitinophagales bacterium]|nr:YihY/virulence factor BrkB family protein [Chitinophagales bacterium]